VLLIFILDTLAWHFLNKLWKSMAIQLLDKTPLNRVSNFKISLRY
jgi:hypothetical protein